MGPVKKAIGQMSEFRPFRALKCGWDVFTQAAGRLRQPLTWAKSA